MITIATNIFDKLSPAHKTEIESNVGDLFGVKNLKINEYKEKSIETQIKFKFFFGGLPLKQMLADVKVWDSFVKILDSIFSFASIDVGKINDLQFWMTSELKPMPVNMFFSFRNIEDAHEKLQTLRDTLTIVDVLNEKNIQKDKILIVGYDYEGNTWRISYL